MRNRAAYESEIINRREIVNISLPVVLEAVNKVFQSASRVITSGIQFNALR